MIGAVIGEELGLVGILATVLAFAAFTVLGFRIAMRCKDPFGKYLAAGATSLVAGQAIVNFGAVLGFLPLTGVPLPLISSGGSSLVVMLAPGRRHAERGRQRVRRRAALRQPSDDEGCQSDRTPQACKPRVLIAAGGTAGHVVPALAVAAELRARGAQVEFAGGDRIEARLVPEAGYPLHRSRRRIRAAALPGAGRVAVAGGDAPAGLPEDHLPVQPDVVFGAGGYVSGPMLAARAAVPRALARCSRSTRTWVSPTGWRRRWSTACTCPSRSRAGPGGKYLVTGRPIPGSRPTPGAAWSGDRARRSAAAWARAAERRRDRAVGGGRSWVHRAARHRRPRVRAVTGGWTATATACAPSCPSCTGRCAAPTLVVARAGGSIFEIAAAGKPAILVPSPNVTADHQTANARHLERAGGAVVIPDAELTHERLDSEVRGAAGRSGAAAGGWRRRRSRWARPDAAAVIADDLLRLAQAMSFADRRLHMIGIGGAGSLGAGDRRLRLGRGRHGLRPCAVAPYSTALARFGVPVSIGHDPVHLEQGMEVVVSSAIAADEPELLAARDLGLRAAAPRRAARRDGGIAAVDLRRRRTRQDHDVGA